MACNEARERLGDALRLGNVRLGAEKVGKCGETRRQAHWFETLGALSGLRHSTKRGEATHVKKARKQTKSSKFNLKLQRTTNNQQQVTNNDYI